MKKYILLALVAIFALASCKKNAGPESGASDGQPKTDITSVYVGSAKITEDPDGFNMISDPGFEFHIGDPEWKSKSVWFLPEWVSEAETPYNGSRTLYADCNSHDWRDVAIQSISVKKGKTYKITIHYRGAWAGLNAYFGFRYGGESHADVNTNSSLADSKFPDKNNDAWDEYSMSYTNADAPKFDCFFGGWCWDNLWLELDDVKVAPEGEVLDSYIPADGKIDTKSITNTSYKINSMDDMVVWKTGSSTIAGFLVNPEIGGKQRDNVFFTGKINSDGGVEVMHTAKADLQGVVPTGGCTIDKIQYVFAYTPGGMSEGEDPDWVSQGASVYASPDNGETWAETAIFWGADSKFIQNSIAQKGDYYYIFGSKAGDKVVETYVARFKADDIVNKDEFEYWDGEIWFKGNDAVAASVMYGPTSLRSVVYNEERYTYMMIYRSITTGQLVYRDSGLPEGDWSGEKLLVADPSANELMHTPFITAISKDNVKFIATASSAK